MKCLVFSDSHGSVMCMKEVLRMHRDAEVVFFLGDGISDVEQLAISDSTRAWIVVRGNCDFRSVFMNSDVKKVEKISLLGYNIILTHGDLYGAKGGVGGLVNLARQENADILLFGHTHSPHEEYINEYEKPFYLFNPGSASLQSGSFGVLTLGKTVLFSHGNFL